MRRRRVPIFFRNVFYVFPTPYAFNVTARAPVTAAACSLESLMGTPPIDRAAAAADDDDDDADADADAEAGSPPTDAFSTSYRGQNLRELPPGLLGPHLCQPPLSLAVLDLSGNELGALPGVDTLAPTLSALRLSRNWFTAVPPEVAGLELLEELDLSRNFVRGSDEALEVAKLKQLSHLRILDLRYNRKCFKQSQADHLATQLPQVESIRITVSFPAPEGSFVGASPCDRDATSLRAQLEPWSTLALRRRLVDDFHQPATDPEVVGRPEVMRRLLECYQREGGAAGRRVVRVQGTPVDTEVIEELLTELREWRDRRRKGARGNQQERPSISAESYMIIRSPTDFTAKLGAGSRKARQAADKFAKYTRLWELADTAIREVDVEFADTFTALAVTYGFQGSPHIDKQNIGPFYGLALGRFKEGQGGICVECDARTVGIVNTRNRLGKVDGRFPHWVAPYDEGSERFSLIYYLTMGEPTPIRSAVFEAEQTFEY